MVAVILLCQRTYLNKWGEKDWKLEIAFQLSTIKLSNKRPFKYVKKAGEEIMAFMNMNVQYFITNVVNIYVDSHSSSTYLMFYDWFVPSVIFQTKDYSFKEWLDEHVKDNDAKYVLKKYMMLVLNIANLFSIKNYKRVYLILVKLLLFCASKMQKS